MTSCNSSISGLIKLLVMIVGSVLFLSGCSFSPYTQNVRAWVAISADGSELALERCVSGCAIALYDVKTNSVRVIKNNSSSSWRSPSFSPDGSALVFSASQAKSKWNHIAMVNRDGSHFRVLTTGPGIRYRPVFSPDGTKLAYVCARDWKIVDHGFFVGNMPHFIDMELCVYDFVTGEERVVTALNSISYNSYTFTPEAEHILLKYDSNERDPKSRRFKEPTVIIDLKTGKMQPALQATIDSHISPSSFQLSHNGRKVMFYDRDQSYNFDLFLWSGTSVLDGGGSVRRLTQLQSYMGGKAMSGDGKWAAVWMDRKRKGDYKLYMLKTDGSGQWEIPLPYSPNKTIPVTTAADLMN